MEELLQVWFNTSLQGVAFVEPIHNSQGEIIDFRYRLINSAFARILRLPESKISGQVVKKVFNPTDENDFFVPMLAVIQTGEPQRLLKEYHLDGKDVWHEVTLVRMNDQLMINVQDVSEQKRSERQLKRRLAMESTLSSISSKFINLTNADVDTCVVDALGQISGQIGAERAVVFLYSDDFLSGSCSYEWCAPGILSRKAANQKIPVTHFAWTHQQLENKQLIHLEADYLPPEAHQEKAVFTLMAIHSMIAIPLVREERTHGFVGFYTINKSQSWDQNDVSLLETFAILITNLLQRIEQETAIRQANNRLEGLHAIDQALLSYRLADQSPLLIAMRYMYFMVPCERIAVFQIQAASILAEIKCRIIAGELEVSTGLQVSSGFFQKQFNQGWRADQCLYHPDIKSHTSSDQVFQSLYELGIRSLVAIPLYSQKELIGVFTLASVTPYFFTEEQIEIAQELASPLAIVLHQQQLDEQLKNYTDQLEQRVCERTREINRLSAIHQAILKHAGHAIISTDVHGVIKTANQASENLIGYPVDELIGMVVHAAFGPPENPVPHITCHPAGTTLSFSNVLGESLENQGYYYGECVVFNKNGSQMSVLITVSRLYDEDNIPIGYAGIATDISALKTAEMKLRKINQKLNAVFEGAIDLHCIADLQGKLLNVNRALGLTLGYSAEELDGLTFSDLLWTHELVWVRQQFQGLANNESIRNQINQFRKKDGTCCTLEWNAVRIDHHIYASARDITDRQLSDNQLRTLNQRLQLATQAAKQGIWEMDMEQNKLTWDDRLWELHGRTPDNNDWNFEKFLTLIHPDDQEAFLTASSQPDVDDTMTNVARIIRPDGAIRYMETSGILIRNAAGKPVRAIGVVWDITERKRAEEALRESEQRFREIAENVDEIFWIHSAEPFRLLYLNPAYERIWDAGFAQLSQNHYAFMDTILKEDQPAVWNMLEKYKHGIAGQMYFRQQEPGGPVRWLFLRTFMIHNANGQLIRHIGIINDVTSQKEKELVLQQALQHEQQLNQLKSQFVSTASHEFRTPLATIQSSVDLIRLYLDVPSEKARTSMKKHVAVIEKEIDQFSILLTDILTIGTIESGKVSFNPHWIDIVRTCEEMIATHFSRREDRRTVQLRLDGKPRLVYLDNKLISHVVVNLLSNAFKFSLDNPLLIIVFNETSLTLQVIDKGIGIPARELETLFQAFSRASNTSGIPGTGLGLVIAKQFVELHGGHLAINSEERKGTTCTVTIPIGCAEGASLQLVNSPESTHK